MNYTLKTTYKASYLDFNWAFTMWDSEEHLYSHYESERYTVSWYGVAHLANLRSRSPASAPNL